LASSIDGPLITGRGGDIIIIDDPHKLSDVQSQGKRDHVNECCRNALFSRFDDNVTNAIVIVMQRLDDDDLCGSVLKTSNNWTVLSLPAIAEKDEQIQIGDNVYHLRRAGDLLHAEWLPKAELDDRRSLLGDDIFAAQYQQCPVPRTPALIKWDSVQRYDPPLTRTKSSYIIQSWDTALGTEITHDYSVCTTWLVQEPYYYLLHVLRGHFDFPELRALAISHGREHNPNKVLVEDAALGKALVTELKCAGLHAVAIKPEFDKVTRFQLQLPKFASRHVFLPNEAPWLAVLEAELFAFPYGRNDDQVDSMIQALAHGRPSWPWNDASLEGLSKLATGLW
jgi:predicted phage terminase large subunit-like protein